MKRLVIASLLVLTACPRPGTPDAGKNPPGPVDAFVPECAAAEDCPGSATACATVGGCGCGSFKTCIDGLCRAYARDCGDGGVDAGRPDAGEGRCFSTEDCPGLFPACEDLSCACGSFKTCRENRCINFSSEHCPRPDAGTIDAGPTDAGELDAAIDDAGPVDAFVPECSAASECSDFFPACADFTCECGTYATCYAGRCLTYSLSGCPRPTDAGVTTDAALTDAALPADAG